MSELRSILDAGNPVPHIEADLVDEQLLARVQARLGDDGERTLGRSIAHLSSHRPMILAGGAVMIGAAIAVVLAAMRGQSGERNR